MLCFVVARCGYSGLIKMSVGNANINLTISDVQLCDSLSFSYSVRAGWNTYDTFEISNTIDFLISIVSIGGYCGYCDERSDE